SSIRNPPNTPCLRVTGFPAARVFDQFMRPSYVRVMQNLETRQPEATEASLEFELAYQSRVAMDRIRFVIKQTEFEKLSPAMLREVGFQLLDALERLGTAERHFQERSGHTSTGLELPSCLSAAPNGSR